MTSVAKNDGDFSIIKRSKTDFDVSFQSASDCQKRGHWVTKSTYISIHQLGMDDATSVQKLYQCLPTWNAQKEGYWTYLNILVMSYLNLPENCFGHKKACARKEYPEWPETGSKDEDVNEKDCVDADNDKSRKSEERTQCPAVIQFLATCNSRRDQRNDCSWHQSAKPL